MSADENELERFEAELRGVRPARPPADFLQRLKSEAPALVTERRAELAQADRSAASAKVRSSKPGAWSSWLRPLLRWTVPATALLAVGAIVWQANLPAAGSPMKADDVRIDQQLVSTFDTVVALPSGEPVRFRCRQWLDEVVLRDSKRGVEVARRVPRVEVVPVRFETY
jgi:negative regulator of sigma E activity